MNKGKISLIIFAVLAVLTVFIFSASAQEIDVDSMDNEQLTALLLQILNKIQQEEAAEAGSDTESVPEVPAADPERNEEAIQFTVYDNKKLIIESLPGYLFIQKSPEKEEQEPETDNKKDDSDHVPGTVCDPNFPDFCFWWPVDGQVVCVCGELG